MGSHRYEAEVEIPRPPAEVYAILVDWEASPRWLPGAESATRAPAGPTRVGTKVSISRKILGKTVVTHVEVTACEPGRLLATRVDGSHGGSARLELSPVAGGTRVTFSLELDAAGISIFKLPLVAAAARHQMRADLEALRAYAEST